MSDRRYTPRPSLPEGYQYGDGGKFRFDKVYGAMCSTCSREMVYQPVLHAWVCETCPARICLPWTDDCFRETGWRIGDTVTVKLRNPPNPGDLRRHADGHWECFDGSAWFRYGPWTRQTIPPTWRAPHENAAAQLTRSHVHDFRARYDEGIYFAICAGCGLNAGPVDCSRMEVLCGIGTPTQRTGEETI